MVVTAVQHCGEALSNHGFANDNNVFAAIMAISGQGLGFQTQSRLIFLTLHTIYHRNKRRKPVGLGRQLVGAQPCNARKPHGDA